jgi:transcriptional regulator NrdR
VRCPFCQSEHTQVVDTRSNPEANTIRRRRKCLKCDKRFTTYERVDLKMPRLVKKDGSRTDFDREKLTASMRLALRKRPVATEAVDSAGRSHRGEAARARRARGADEPRRRHGDARARAARQDRVHPLRFGVSQLRDAGRFPRSRAGSREVDPAPAVTGFSAFDHAMMRRALLLAEKGLYSTTPNPRVGCVLARDGAIVGEGWHEKPGAPHAEANALAAAGPAARGATAYVSLEPCNHHGRTPPCSAALAAAGVARVVSAVRDPNPLARDGSDALAAAGIQGRGRAAGRGGRELNIGFLSRMTRARPVGADENRRHAGWTDCARGRAQPVDHRR